MGAGDVTYQVLTRYTIQGITDVKRQVKDLSDAHTQAAAAANAHSAALASLGAAMAGFVAARAFVQAIEDVISTTVRAAGNMESLQIAIAALMQASNVPGISKPEQFQLSMEASARLIAKMRDDAAALPGEFQDLMNIFRPILPVGRSTGMSVNEIEKFASRMMATSALLQVDSQIAGREMAGMLMGNVREIMPLWRALKPIISEHADQYVFLNKQQREGLKNLEGMKSTWRTLTVQQRMMVTEAATDSLQAGIERVGTSWEAISSSTTQYIGQLKIAMGPLEEMKRVLGEMNEYYRQHQEFIDGIARRIGEELSDAVHDVWGFVKETMQWMIDHKSEFDEIFDVLASPAPAIALAGIGGTFFGPAGVLAGGGIGAGISYLASRHKVAEQRKMEAGWNKALPGLDVTNANAETLRNINAQGESETGRSAYESQVGAELARDILKKTDTIGQFLHDRGLKSEEQIVPWLNSAGVDVSDQRRKASELMEALRAYDVAKAFKDNKDPLDARTKGKGGETPEGKGTVINIHQQNNIYEADDPDRVRVEIRKGTLSALNHPDTGVHSLHIGK